MTLAKLSSKSQIVLPAKIRKSLAIKPGDTLEITTDNEAIIIRKAPASFVDELERCASSIWRDYKRELDQSRDQWDC